MNKATSDASILSITLDKASREPLQAQLLRLLRGLVHVGRLRSGSRLPSSRNLAQELTVSRVTTTTVYEQLIAEGYFEGRRGSGVYVAADLPNLPIRSTEETTDYREKPLPLNQSLRPFEVGYPDLAAFPYREWTRLHDRIWRSPGLGILGRSHPFGFGPLRNAIAEHLNEWRGIRCSAEQIVITSGLVDAIELIVRAAFAPGDTVLVEDPGHKILVNALTGRSLVCEPVLVDQQGFNLARAKLAARSAKAISVTPSRQYPLGMTLTLARRLELLAWAERHAGYILEDDYDGEFRYQGQPLPAMMSLDEDERVIYIGSFSKVMFPALKLGYVVMPNRLLTKVTHVLNQLGPRAALIAQPVLADFMANGSFATHIRRMRRLYADRQKVLLKALHTYADGLLSADAETGGMHLVAELNPQLASEMDDLEVSRRAKEVGLHLAPLTGFFSRPANRQGLVMGYAAFSSAMISESVNRLANALCGP